MFNKKKGTDERRERRQGGGNLSQYGLFDIPTDLNFTENDDGLGNDNDSDLEAELLALSSDGGAKPKRPARKKPASNINMDAMIASSLRDIPSDEELSGDDDDPDLLNELSEITGDDKVEEAEESPKQGEAPSIDIVKLLEDRLEMYKLAESNAKEAGESGRARRFTRGIGTLKDLLKRAKAGGNINQDDIPPEVAVKITKREPPPPPADTLAEPDAPMDTAEPPSGEETPKSVIRDEATLNILNERKNQFKIAAVTAKKAGDVTTAVTYVKIIKQFDAVIAAVESGQPVDLSNMPELPNPNEVKIEQNEIQNKSEESSNVPTEEFEQEVKLIEAGSVLEALEQRLDVYKKQQDAAKEAGNSSKVRRMGRIVKQFEDAIKAHKLGKNVALDELPNPPGYALIPGTKKPEEEAPPASAPAPGPKPQPVDESVAPKPPLPRQNSRSAGNHAPTTRSEKQTALLKQRQREFKEAALNAKKKGELAEAKEFLRTAKGFDPLIAASEGGLPVDIASLPIPPSAKSQLDLEYDLVMAEECTEDDTGVLDVITRLENQLTKQLKLCLTTRDHHKAMGDIAGMNRFEHLALTVTKDLDVVRMAKRTNGAAVPKFHHEKKDFSIVNSFTELNDNELELVIVRGINYTCKDPKDIDTYVKLDFPYPQEETFKERTSTIKDTNNPEYNATFMIPIQRTARPCQRVFKRHAVKFEVYSKGGFFRSDTLLGTVNVKLQPLETQCEIHDSFDLMDGRKKVGGKLEVRLRLRDPLISKEVQQLSERWLIIDH